MYATSRVLKKIPMCGGGKGLERQNKLFAYKQKQYLESIAEIQAHNKFHCTVVLMNNMQPLQESDFADSSNCIQCIIFFFCFSFFTNFDNSVTFTT